ncbi:acyltransferase [Apilactobacillus apinorum]|uniref:acyltransferase n=1 Tax=Apilactobacillus apinorum TaxID=1218495 RepID=UPI00333FFE78
MNNRIEIGSNTIFGENVKIYDHNHRFNLKNKNISDQGFSNGTVKIGNNCWIGSNTTILKGSEIGDNVVIGAGMVIDSKIPSNTIVKRQSNYVINDIQYK